MYESNEAETEDDLLDQEEEALEMENASKANKLSTGEDASEKKTLTRKKNDNRQKSEEKRVPKSSPAPSNPNLITDVYQINIQGASKFCDIRWKFTMLFVLFSEYMYVIILQFIYWH